MTHETNTHTHTLLKTHSHTQRHRNTLSLSPSGGVTELLKEGSASKSLPEGESSNRRTLCTNGEHRRGRGRRRRHGRGRGRGRGRGHRCGHRCKWALGLLPLCFGRESWLPSCSHTCCSRASRSRTSTTHASFSASADSMCATRRRDLLIDTTRRGAARSENFRYVHRSDELLAVRGQIFDFQALPRSDFRTLPRGGGARFSAPPQAARSGS